MKNEDVLTKKQEELLGAISKCRKIKGAAEELGISYPAAKQQSYRIRRNFRFAEQILKYLHEIKFNELLAKIPARQNCEFLNDNGKCRYSNDKIDVNKLDVPCAFWQQSRLRRLNLMIRSRPIKLKRNYLEFGAAHIHMSDGKLKPSLNIFKKLSN